MVRKKGKEAYTNEDRDGAERKEKGRESKFSPVILLGLQRKYHLIHKTFPWSLYLMSNFPAAIAAYKLEKIKRMKRRDKRVRTWSSYSAQQIKISDCEPCLP
jgi:hypothetical protein